MKLFACPVCSQTLYFENAQCGHCGTSVGYAPSQQRMVALSPETILCANAAHAACNWLVEDANAPDGLCAACVHNETIPDLSNPDNLAHWQTIERAKKRLFYGLMRLNLPLATKDQAPETGLAFRFLADSENGEPVMTGHADGLITIALAEADDAERAQRRAAMGEPYRTLLGHFRHEIAHYYWDILIKDGPMLDECRAMFGDDREGYGQALQSHYANGAPLGWQESFVSSYATAHPWEDFAETWAHFLHIIDTLETAASFGLDIAPKTDVSGDLSTAVAIDPYRSSDITSIIDHWVPVSIMLNNLNRAVGHEDAYPFVLTPAIIEKLGVIARLVHAGRP